MYFQGKKNTYFTMFSTAKRIVPERNLFRSDQPKLDGGFIQTIASVFTFHRKTHTKSLTFFFQISLRYNWHLEVTINIGDCIHLPLKKQ